MQTYSSYLMNMQTLSFDFRAWTKILQELVISIHTSLFWELKYDLEVHPKAGKMRAFHSVFVFVFINEAHKRSEKDSKCGILKWKLVEWTYNMHSQFKWDYQTKTIQTQGGNFQTVKTTFWGKSASMSSTSVRNPNDHDSSNQHLW